MKYTHLLQDDAPELYPPDDVAPLPIDGAVHAPKAETVAGGATARLSLEAAEVQAGGVAAPLPLGSAAHALEALASAGSAVGGLKTKNHGSVTIKIWKPYPNLGQCGYSLEGLPSWVTAFTLSAMVPPPSAGLNKSLNSKCFENKCFHFTTHKPFR